MRKQSYFVVGVAAFALLGTGIAQAGGLERGGYNIDLLFDPSDYAAEATATYVNPQRDFKNAVDTDRTTGLPVPTGSGGGDLNGRPRSTEESEGYWVPRGGVKAGFGPVDCMVEYSQPFGAHAKPGHNWAGANENIETKFDTDSYAATCSYAWDVGQGQLRVIGGALYQEISGFKERLVQDFSGIPVPFTGVGRLELEDSAWGWRAGLAYEVPDYALRTSLVYNSEVNYNDLSGFIDLRQAGRTKYDVSGAAVVPDSLELKVQGGIAPDWLAFGSVKWTDWSELQIVRFCPAAPSALTPCTSLDLLYRDGWTVTGGIGHKFNDQWSGAVSIAWDRGTSDGVGSQTDTWTLGTGVTYAPTANVELRFAGAIGVLTSGSSGSKVYDGQLYGDDVAYDFGNDIVTAISVGLKVKF